MIGLPTSTISSTSLVAILAFEHSSSASEFSDVRIAEVSSLSPPGFIITYDTRLMRSSPKRICGFMTPALATTSPVVRSMR